MNKSVSMFEKKLLKKLKEASLIRQRAVENHYASYFNDNFQDLSEFILKNLSNSLFKNRNLKVIANHFGEILPYIVLSNIDIILLHFESLSKQPYFKEQFIEGLKKYPYVDGLEQILYNIYY